MLSLHTNIYSQLIDTLAELVTLSYDQKKYCRRLFSIRRYSRNEYLLNMGETWRNIFFIYRGALRLFYTTDDGREFNKGFFFENQFAWPIAPFARDTPSKFSIATLEESVLLVADFQVFKEYLRQIDCWDRFALFHAEWLAEQKVMREEEFLLRSAEQRYLNFVNEFSTQLDRIPDYHIASYIGITGVSLSRIRKKLVTH